MSVTFGALFACPDFVPELYDLHALYGVRRVLCHALILRDGAPRYHWLREPTASSPSPRPRLSRIRAVDAVRDVLAGGAYARLPPPSCATPSRLMTRPAWCLVLGSAEPAYGPRRPGPRHRR